MLPFYHIEGGSDNSVIVEVLGKRKTPEPASVPCLLPGLLHILRKCWKFDPGERPDARSCLRSLAERLLEKRPSEWDLDDPVSTVHVLCIPSHTDGSSDLLVL